eukprot:11602263-Alexandrium_andersonii.AAC.1
MSARHDAHRSGGGLLGRQAATLAACPSEAEAFAISVVRCCAVVLGCALPALLCSALLCCAGLCCAVLC